MISHMSEKFLIKIARESIAFGLEHGVLGVLQAGTNLPADLLKQSAAFVTLYLEHQLRGCIGSIKANRSLAEDVLVNAYLAAFQDKRFSPLCIAEFSKIEIDIAVLTKPELLLFHSEEELREILRPHIDGLIIQAKTHHGVFLPVVWDMLPDKALFLNQLKHKAGLPDDYWSNDLVAWRFETYIIHEDNVSENSKLPPP